MATIVIDGIEEEYLDIAHSKEMKDFYVTNIEELDNGNVKYTGFYINDNTAKPTILYKEDFEQHGYVLESRSKDGEKTEADEVVQGNEEGTNTGPSFRAGNEDITYVEINKVSECGRTFVDKANELDTLMDNLNTEFVKTIDAGWVDDNSTNLKQMFFDFIEESKIINGDVKDYGKTITEAALNYNKEQRNSIIKIGDDYYGK